MDFELPLDFKELLRLLSESGVEYVLVGGYAVALHGYVRTTNDIDIFISGDTDNAERLVKALTDFGFGGSDLTADLFTRKDSLVRMGVEPIKVEILNFISGLDFETAYLNRKVVPVEDIEVNLISLDDLYTNKMASGRLKDLADIEELKQINQPSSE